MKRYFKHWAECDDFEGTAYLEFEGDWATRQVVVCGCPAWHLGDEHHLENLPDLPFAELELGAEHAISAEEFERIWEEALSRCPPAS